MLNVRRWSKLQFEHNIKYNTFEIKKYNLYVSLYLKSSTLFTGLCAHHAINIERHGMIVWRHHSGYLRLERSSLILLIYAFIYLL